MRIHPFAQAVVCLAVSSLGSACGNSSTPSGGVGGASAATGSSGAGGAGMTSGTGGAGGANAGGAGAGSLPGNAIKGSVMGMNFAVAATSYWIGHPSAGGAQTQIYISDERLPCQAISAPGWDKTIGASSQVLEFGLASATVSTFTIRTDADANYLGGPYNPSADTGTVTIAEVHPSQNMVGSFDLHFGADSLSGTFDASFCAAGVEP